MQLFSFIVCCCYSSDNTEWITLYSCYPGWAEYLPEIRVQVIIFIVKLFMISRVDYVYNFFFSFKIFLLNIFFTQIFHDVAYKAKDRNDLLSGIDEFLDQVTVLPPGEWDPSIRIEPPKSVPSQVRIQSYSSVTYFILMKLFLISYDSKTKTEKLYPHLVPFTFLPLHLPPMGGPFFTSFLSFSFFIQYLKL